VSGLPALRVMVLGLRGFPDVEGGIERHAEQLYPRLTELGCSVTVVVRSPYHPKTKPREYRGVRLARLWSPRRGALETLVHTFLGTLYAGVVRPDLLHIHAIGPSLFTPLARLLGLRVVVTHHGPDYDREKWNSFAKGVLRAGEMVGMRFANQRIAISKTIQDLIREQHGRDCVLIPNGVELPDLPRTCDKPRELGLVPGKYVLLVGRFVPEKRHLDLLRAFAAARLPGWKLALVGGIDETDAYIQEVMRCAAADPNVVLTGYQKGRALNELYAHAGLFVLPSSHEGLPIALLEALSFGLRAIASEIPAHVELGLAKESYFPVGNVAELAARLGDFAVPIPQTEKLERVARLRTWVKERYDWKTIAERTSEVFKDAIA
jgi:glycosyltransferase involved in cell wall biosynthesis